jgi:TolB-like protein/Flp pilus assembly protein TadD
MGHNASAISSVHFGLYELDPINGELRKGGTPIRVQPQPFKVLALLASRAGQLVSKEEIRCHLWGTETFVDVEKGMSFCIRQARSALGDNAKSPHFIETLPRRGYRFIAPVDRRAPAEPRAMEKIETEVPRESVLAVLPFGNISTDPEQDYFSDGMTEALITELAQISTIRVISRTSVMKYKNLKRSLSQIARELKVNAVVEGVVLRSGRRVRIAAQLIDAATNRLLWADSYERELRDILGLQSAVARAIASRIKVQLTPEEQQRLSNHKVVNPDAYETYLKGRYHWNKRTDRGMRKSIEYFGQAIQIDADCAVAYAGLADAYSTLGFYEDPARAPKEYFSKAKIAAAKAIQLDEGLAEAHTSLGLVRWVYDWDWLDADRHFQRALALNPNYATARHWYSLCLASMKNLQTALSEIKQARTLDPLSLSINTSMALCCYLARHYDDAIEHARKTLEIEPGYMMAHTALGLAYGQQGKFAESINEFQKAALHSKKSLMVEAALGHAYGMAGRKTDAQKSLDNIVDLSKRTHVCSFAQALIRVGLGEESKAINALQNAFEERSGWLVYVDVEPRFDRLRSNPAFHDFRRRLKAAS